jgi:hypothetical protein
MNCPTRAASWYERENPIMQLALLFKEPYIAHRSPGEAGNSHDAIDGVGSSTRREPN